MTFSYIPQLICLLTGLIEIHSEIITVSKVSVEAGRSISIPCLYDPHYTNHVKYLCKGYYWISCKPVVTTDQRSSGRFSISDDKNRRIFTVTINDLTSGDTGWWWCAVEIGGHDIIDERAYFYLSVTKDVPSLSVDQQEIVAFEGGSVTVICRYKNDRVTAWCRLNNTCVTAKDQTGTIDGTTVTINQSRLKTFLNFVVVCYYRTDH
ncbi:polymeric immunoglobulin receptor-like [Larimichthys crocea]|uniref:polymeric immunoglobulin receptor-like n=1 Tax=Larimichthys crocea TaxID=215358 RepID=UPI000F6037DF|nr:polymeric immunoglobulin receptor-like [Larimichthys crocea]